MEIGFKPLHFELSKRVASISVLGIVYSKNNCTVERSIGFSFRKEKLQDRSNWIFRLFFYGHVKKFHLKTILDSYYIRCDCGKLRWKDSNYCSACDSDGDCRDEYTFVYRDLNEYIAAKAEGDLSGYKVEYEYTL